MLKFLVMLGMLIVSSCELFISYITCNLIILLYICIIYWWSISTVSWFLLLLYMYTVVVFLCMHVCVCVYGLLPYSNKD